MLAGFSNLGNTAAPSIYVTSLETGIGNKRIPRNRGMGSALVFKYFPPSPLAKITKILRKNHRGHREHRERREIDSRKERQDRGDSEVKTWMNRIDRIRKTTEDTESTERGRVRVNSHKKAQKHKIPNWRPRRLISVLICVIRGLYQTSPLRGWMPAATGWSCAPTGNH